MTWQLDRDEVGEAHELSKSEGRNEFDFSRKGLEAPIIHRDQTIFVNAAWMTMQKRAVPKRNSPFVVSLGLPSKL